MDRPPRITEESDFYFWLVEYFQKLGPMKMYPKTLADAADLALEIIADVQHEEEALQELVPEAKICPCCGDKRNQALGVVFHLARKIEDQRPYSEVVIHFLAEVYCPPASTMFEEAARIGFKLAGFQRTRFFEEYREGNLLHLVTTTEGRAALGVEVDLEYPHHHPFFPKRQRKQKKPTSLKRVARGRPVLRVISPE